LSVAPLKDPKLSLLCYYSPITEDQKKKKKKEIFDQNRTRTLPTPSSVRDSMQRLLLTKYDHTVQTIIIVPLTLSPLSLLLPVRLVDYMVNLCVFYFYKIIGKLTTF
jgi:hypothetical protein